MKADAQAKDPLAGAPGASDRFLLHWRNTEMSVPGSEQQLPDDFIAQR